MKRLVIILGGLLALPAFAEVAPFYYDGVTEYADTEMNDGGAVVGDEIVAEENAIAAPIVPSRPAARASATRNASRATPSNVTTGNRVSNSRVVASRGATGAVTARSAGTQRATVARAGTTTLTTSGGSLYLPNNTGRVGVRAAGSVARAPSVGSVSVSNTTTTTADTVKEATENMDNLMELTDYCKAQYTACMDNFCDVLDDNQGRCSCSKNVKNYEKTEDALRAATEELQDVAQRIQYIGLTAEEITTLFAETEAESAMQSKSDNSKLKSDLDRIKNMIVGVKSGSASAIGDTAGISLDLSNLLSFNIDSTGFDLSALFGTTSQNTSSIGNQRGEALYKTAAARCKSAVLTQCTAQGVDAGVIVNSYDVEIDKQCILYERALTDSNTQMSATVRNAKTVLQKARLMVAQQKNQYDLRGCISALDSCMQDDYVCGTDYEDCLDPTGKYIVDGKVVVGSKPGLSGGDWANDNAVTASSGLYQVWNNSGKSNQNIWAPAANVASPYTLTEYIEDTVNLTAAQNSKSHEMSAFLQNKLGYNEGGKNYGMCISILNKCQNYTYDREGKYLANNSVIKNYMQRAFRQIKSVQDEVLANYASSCLSDVTSCLSQNRYAYDSTTDNNYSDIAIRACLPVINTCRSVTLGTQDDADLTEAKEWLDTSGVAKYSNQGICEASHGNWNATSKSCICNTSTTLLTDVTEDSKVVSCKCPTATPAWSTASGKCVTQAQANCEGDGGTWSNSTCTCGTGKTWDTTNLHCKASS